MTAVIVYGFAYQENVGRLARQVGEPREHRESGKRHCECHAPAAPREEEESQNDRQHARPDQDGETAPENEQHGGQQTAGQQVFIRQHISRFADQVQVGWSNLEGGIQAEILEGIQRRPASLAIQGIPLCRGGGRRVSTRASTDAQQSASACSRRARSSRLISR